MVNDKLLPIPLVLLLSAYQFYLLLLTNLHILNWAGDIPATAGSPWLEKHCFMVSQWVRTKYLTSGGRDSSVWFVVVYIGTRGTSKNICVIAGIYQPETLMQDGLSCETL